MHNGPDITKFNSGLAQENLSKFSNQQQDQFVIPPPVAPFSGPAPAAKGMQPKVIRNENANIPKKKEPKWQPAVKKEPQW